MATITIGEELAYHCTADNSRRAKFESEPPPGHSGARAT